MKFLIYLIFCISIASAYRRRSKCQETITVEDREEMAQIIFTGTVRKIYRIGTDRTSNYNAIVQLKKVIKCKLDVISADFVAVIGLGNKDMCESDVKERDTRIFLVSVLKENFFRLNSSLLRIGRDNLDMVSDAVQGKRKFKYQFSSLLKLLFRNYILQSISVM